MDFESLLRVVGEEPVFSSSLLLAGRQDPGQVHRQLSRWVSNGSLIQLRRGLYALAPPFQKIPPHPFLIANRLGSASYVSLQSSLAWAGLIPEHVAVVTSLSSRRPGSLATPLGHFLFRHVQPRLLFGYRSVPVGGGQEALVALPEKALLDMIYLQSQGDTMEYLHHLRLQHLDQLDLNRLKEFGHRFRKPKIGRAIEIISALVASERKNGEQL